MKPRPKTFFGLVGLLLLVVCVQYSDEFSLREKRDTESVSKESSDAKPNKPSKTIKPTLSSKILSKKTLPGKKSRVPAVAEDNRIVFGKVKISDLKPCISKAFCEVNSITEEPTYEATKEFYVILNRLKKYIDEDEKDIINSGSVEEDEPSSEESSVSYEHIPHGPPPGRDAFPYPGSQYPPRYPGYRRGKSLKTKNKVKLAAGLTEKPGLNGTENTNGTTDGVSGTQKGRSAKLDLQENPEKSEFVARKTRELNVVDDLAALIKISAEIGQALRSPRRCRTLFKRCEMSYEEIINIFNRTQKVESSDSSPEKTVKPSAIVTEATPVASSTSGDKDDSAVPGGGDSGEGNRNKKSRDEFSDEEDIEYITDSEIQPVKTYSLFSPSVHHDRRHPEEILVDEAFKKFENTFPASGAPENLEYIKTELRKSSSKSKKSHAFDEEEEDESDESASGSRETISGFRGGATHRSSEWSDPVSKHKYPSKYPEDDDPAGFDDGAGDDGSNKKKEPASSEEEEEEDDEPGSEEDPSQAGTSLHTRDEEEVPDENARAPHSSEDEPEYEEERPLKKNKGKKRGSKKKISSKPPADESSEEEQEMPPQGSPFYGHMSQLNDGQGVEVVPQKIPKDKKKQKKGKRKPSSSHQGDEQDDEPQQQDYPGGQGGGGPPGDGYYPHSDSPSPPSGNGGGFFQSIMSWFSGGNKQGSAPNGAHSSQEQQPYGGGQGGGGSQSYGGGQGGGGSQSYGGGQGGGGSQSYGGGQQGGGSPSYFGGKPYGGYNKELPTYEDYKPGSKGGRPSRYPVEDTHSRPSYSSDEESEYNPPSRRQNKSKRRPAPQGRVEEDSSEEAEEDDEDESIRRKPSSSKKPSKSSSKSSKTENNKKTNVKTRVAPPPPVIIVPEGEVDPYTPSQDAKPSPPSKKKPSKDSVNSDEESREETSSEEADRNRNSHKRRREPVSGPSESNRKSNSRPSSGSPGGVPSYEKYFTNIFGTVEENQPKMKSVQPEERENTSILMSEFDKISSSFSTSADKIPDWSEEDNPRKKINVGSLASNGKTSKGKYTVNKNRNRNKQYSSGSYEEPTKDAKESSEEEDKKKK